MPQSNRLPRHQQIVALLLVVTLLVSVTLIAVTPTAGAAEPIMSVAATIETQPVPHSGDAADDPAIWVNPTDASKSTIIGTDKKGGLAVYDLSGQQIQYLADGNMNNVDLRAGFLLSGQPVALVTASRRGSNTIAIYKVNPSTRQLENVATRSITTASPAYGACMYRSARSGKTYYFVNTEDKGQVEQWELFDAGSGKVDGKLVRAFTVGSQTEGCVADDALGSLYIGEEAKGIWKYGAEPDAGTSRTQVDTTGSSGHLSADVEGLAIAYSPNGTGYLIASSQGNNSFVLYTREGANSYVKTFQVVDGAIDGVSDTDGIDVTTANLGAGFSQGLFIAQDGTNDGGNQNFKLVPWQVIAGGTGPAPTTTPPPPTTTPRPGTPQPTTTPRPGTPQPTATPSPTQPAAVPCTEIPIASVKAIGDDGNKPANVLDNNLATRWSYEPTPGWIEADLGSVRTVCGISVGWYKGDQRVNTFEVQVSSNRKQYQTIFTGASSGTTTTIESYRFAATQVRYVRVTVVKNTHNEWASITELDVLSGSGTATATPTPTARTGTPSPSPTPKPGTPSPSPTPRPAPHTGMWISPDELAALPMSGPAWEQLKGAADGDLGTPDISDQDSNHDVNTLAVALVYARTGTASYRTKAADAILGAIGTEDGGRTLALGRNLVSYVIAADLIDLTSYDAAKDQQFRAWLAAVRTEVLDSKTLISTHEDRPNNWGTHAGASRIATDLYLGDTADLERAAKVFKGWLGDRTSYAGFAYGDLSWQADPQNPVGINPKGSSKDGHSIDGAIPDDMRRGCSFQWPPCETNYPWGALEGALVQAALLDRAGYGAWAWQDQALRRAVQYLSDLDREVGGWWAEGDDEWMVPLTNSAYGTNFPVPIPANPGKNMGWTDWTHAR